MMYVGHLRERLPDETSCKLVVGPAGRSLPRNVTARRSIPALHLGAHHQQAPVVAAGVRNKKCNSPSRLCCTRSSLSSTTQLLPCWQTLHSIQSHPVEHVRCSRHTTDTAESSKLLNQCITMPGTCPVMPATCSPAHRPSPSRPSSSLLPHHTNSTLSSLQSPTHPCTPAPPPPPPPPGAVPPKALAENIKLLFLFDKLRHLELSFSDDSYTYDHSCMAALAELLHLTSLHITGGQPAPDADPAALYSIKGLQELRLLPALDTGLTPEQVAGVAWLTGLTSLRFTGDRELTDDEVLRSLEPLQQLRELHVSPVAEEVGPEGLKALAALRSISTLTLGLHNAQVRHHYMLDRLAFC
jgi:hypothetical protein